MKSANDIQQVYATPEAEMSYLLQNPDVLVSPQDRIRLMQYSLETINDLRAQLTAVQKLNTQLLRGPIDENRAKALLAMAGDLDNARMILVGAISTIREVV